MMKIIEQMQAIPANELVPFDIEIGENEIVIGELSNDLLRLHHIHKHWSKQTRELLEYLEKIQNDHGEEHENHDHSPSDFDKHHEVMKSQIKKLHLLKEKASYYRDVFWGILKIEFEKEFEKHEGFNDLGLREGNKIVLFASKENTEHDHLPISLLMSAVSRFESEF